ncbi:unnamed protein product [Sphagnum jensenii]|uniref:CCR4-NOT transcription complex subunit 1 n=1 Tax=Sphagnum jensenii TaxID=128206 RepID=A0ABP1AX13_9BRYO
MFSFASPLASQIGFLIASLNKSNYKSLALELNQLADYGLDGSVLLLRNCLQQFDWLEGSGELQQHKWPLKLDLLSLVVKKLLRQPNAGSVFCEAVQHILSSVVTKAFLENLSTELKLSLPEQIQLGLALTDAEELSHCQAGHSFCKAKISEIYQTLTPAGLSEVLIEKILWFLRQTEGLSRHEQTFVKALPSLEPDALSSLLLTPLILHDQVHEVNCLRSFKQVATSGIFTSADMLSQLSGATSVVAVMEELGYSCTVNVEHCKEIFSMFPSLSEFDVAQIVGMVARTYKGLEDLQGTHDTFCTAFCNNGEQLSGVWSTTWNVDVLVEAISELAPGISWRSVMENLDHDGFSLPDQKGFLLLLTVYNKACQDPFPLEAVCGKVWRNGEGQLSFLKHAVSAPPEIFTFSHSSRKQAPLENIQGQKLSYGTPNCAWLSLELLEVLCSLAEMGHVGSVRALLELPLKHCPELLVLGLAQIKTEWNTIQSEILSALLPSFFASNSTAGVLHQLWVLNPEAVTRTMVEMHTSDRSYISRILDVCQELKAMNTILETAPFSLSIELAAIAARRDFLNLEKWLQDNLTIHRDSFFQACLKFLRERTLDEARVEGQLGAGVTGQRPGPILSLSLDTVNAFFKVLQVNAAQLASRDPAEELKRIKDAAIRLNPWLMSAGAASEQSQVETTYGSDVEEEANSYFQRIYIGQLSINNVVDMLQRFNMAPPDSREKAIFSCMLQSLFDEYRFFPRYPERELRITAILFGSLIKHQLMFSFGLAALDQFKDRLVEWPQYCNHILLITHIRETHSELVEFIERALSRVARPQQPEIVQNVMMTSTAQQHLTPAVLQPLPPLSTSTPTESLEGATGPALPSDILSSQSQFVPGKVTDTVLHGSLQAGTPVPLLGSQSQSQAAALTPLPLQQGQPQHAALQEEKLKVGGSSSVETVKAVLSLSTLSVPSSQQQSLAPGSQPFDLGRFGHALNIETLVAAAERRDTPIEPPSSEVQDKVAFIINNIVTANLEQKAKECLEVLKEQYFTWFAQYMVMKRASIEPNFHDLYLKFLDKINSKGLQKEIIKATYENCKVLLRSELIKSSSEERSLLKNLGSWLGKLTIGRNQALRAREVDPKALITEAYEKGLMIAVIPFTSKILEPCQSSLAYQPPNPWTMGILGLLAEIYALPNLKMNLKFDIEVLYKNLGVDMKDVKPTQLLRGRTREIEGNPDFSNKDSTHVQQQLQPVAPIPPESTGGAQMLPMLSQSEVEFPQELPAPVPHPTAVVTVASLSQVSLKPELDSSCKVTASLVLYSYTSCELGLQVAMSIPNLAAYVVLNPKLATLGQQLQLSRIVPLAMERAIREIITPVVDRSVTIACMTTRELVMKDYAMEAEEAQTHQAAKLMVASLAGSLAHVTCKEPLRLAMANHLRSLLQVVNLVTEVLEQAVNLVTNDNLDLGCAVIEKAATEKALGDLDEAIGPALAMRRNQRDLAGTVYYDAAFYTGNNLARLPEALRPKPGRLTNAQQRVYEDFARLPWQHSQPTPAPAGPAPAASTLSAQAVYAGVQQASQGSFTNAGGSQPPMTTIGGIAQAAGDLLPDEVDLQAQSPLRFDNATFSWLSTAARQSQDSSLILTSFPGISTSTLESGGVEATSVVKQQGSVSSSGALSPSPPLPTDQLGGPLVEPSLTTGEAIDKYQLVAQKVESDYPLISLSWSFNTLVMEVQEVILQGISRDEAALAIAQKVFKRLYENTTSDVHVSVHLAILESIRDVCKRVVKELTSWVIYSDDERKFNREITVGLIRSELIILTDYNLHLAKLIDGGRNKDAVDFAAYLVKTCVIDDAGVSNTEFYNVIEALGKLAAQPGSPESLQQLVEIAKSTSSASSGQGGSSTGKDDKARLTKDKKLLSSRNAGLRDDGKVGSRDMAAGDPAGLRDQVAVLFDEWARICDSPGSNDKAYAVYLSQLQHLGMLKGDDSSDRFFRILVELAVAHCLNTELQLPSSGPGGEPRQQGGNLSFAAIDMFAKLVILLVKYNVDPSMSKVNLLNKVLNVTVRVIQRDAHERKTAFHPRPYFRLFVTWLMDFNSADSTLDSSNFQVLTAFGNALLALQPLQVPGWSFAWLELISHRAFMPKLLLSNPQKGWPLFQRLLVALFKFMEPYLRNADVSDPVRLLYKGTLRVLLVLLHDFPEFLCDHHFSFCDVIPPSCIQMRNLILSAFPRNMRLPDPFTPNLKVDLLPEISQAPRILSDVESALKNKQLKAEVDDYLKTRQRLSLLSVDLKGRLMLPPAEAVSSGTKYNVPLLNALVLYVGMQAIQQLQTKTTQQQLAVPSAPITHSAPMDIFQHLVLELDTEGRYLFLNAVANQLRYPNNHTHYFSCVLLYLFAEANLEIIQEQITRVLLERLIVNRPHPWGLLITFIELIKNPRYSFWTHSFTRCAPEIEKLFESVARSCMGPPLKSVDDDISGSLSSDGMKG